MNWLKQVGNRKEDKAHTALGTLASALIRDAEVKPNDWLLQLGTSILGHHTYLPTAKDIDRRFTDGARVLVKTTRGFYRLPKLENVNRFLARQKHFSSR